MGSGRREAGYDTGEYGSTILIIWRVFHRYHVGVLFLCLLMFEVGDFDSP